MPASTAPAPVATSFTTDDGVALRGHSWRAEGSDARRPVVLINAATSVRAAYYHRFAAYLRGQGMDVLTYDYRGIGESRPRTLRGFHAGWYDWAATTPRPPFRKPCGNAPGSRCCSWATASAAR